MARPKKKIEARQVQKLAEYGLNNTEIAEVYKVSEGTIRKGFSEFLTKGRLNVKIKLLRKQLEVAMKGNVSMLIWLGKNKLGQTDKVEESGEINLTVNKKEIK